MAAGNRNRLTVSRRKKRRAAFTAADIADATALVNTVGKFEGRRVIDSTNQRTMVSTGYAATDPWQGTVGDVEVTPA